MTYRDDQEKAYARGFTPGSPKDSRTASQDAAIQNAREELDRWRGWAQFVFLGGGPITMSDDDLRLAVCEKFDEEHALRDPGWAAAMGVKPPTR